MLEAPTIFVAFTAGLLSFLAPCVLPIIPAYLSYVGGVSLKDPSAKRRVLFLHALMFSLGFVGLFMIVGLSLGFIAESFLLNKRIYQQIGGAVIILFGLSLIGVLTFEKIFKGRQVRLPKFFEKFRYLRSFAIGFLFGFGWSPCAGPILGIIISLIATQGSIAVGWQLMTVYSIGFILPFLIASIFVSSLVSFFRRFQRAFHYFRIGFGVLIVILGVLFITGDYNDIVVWLTNSTSFTQL